MSRSVAIAIAVDPSRQFTLVDPAQFAPLMLPETSSASMIRFPVRTTLPNESRNVVVSAATMNELTSHVDEPRSPQPLLYVFVATSTANGWILESVTRFESHKIRTMSAWRDNATGSISDTGLRPSITVKYGDIPDVNARQSGSFDCDEIQKLLLMSDKTLNTSLVLTEHGFFEV